MSKEIKVRANLTFEDHQMTITPSGVEFDNDFRNKQYDTEELIRSKIILEINDIAGDDWKLVFNDFPIRKPAYLVDIYLTDHTHLQTIIDIVIKAFPNHYLEFYLPNTYTPIVTHGRFN